jgi:hypothetical protein
VKRDEGGRFAEGNEGGPGNPYVRQVAALRAQLLEAVTPEDLREVVEAIVAAAKGGNLGACKILLDRLLGPPVPADLIARLEELEAVIGGE